MSEQGPSVPPPLPPRRPAMQPLTPPQFDDDLGPLPYPPPRKSNTVLIVVVVVVCCFVGLSCLAGILLPSLGAARRQARKMQNSTQIRGIHQQHVVYSNGNNQFYPGRSTTGANKPAMQATSTMYGAAAPTGNDQSIALAILLNNDAFAPDYLISPIEDAAGNASGATGVGKIEIAPPRSSTFTINPRNCSYAFLRWADAPEQSPSRRDEWFTTMNGYYPVIADRSSSIASNLKTTSLHVSDRSGQSSEWEGSIAWNDNSTRYEGSGIVGKVQMGPSRGGGDDIFSGAAVDGLDAAANVWFSYDK